VICRNFEIYVAAQVLADFRYQELCKNWCSFEGSNVG